ncbi:MAG: polysaccharide deacetylase family protein [Clostridia bacterium]|nr:polysaccharide deacetylase family protein [Clostridia bacterium]
MFIQMYKERYMRFPEGREKAVTFSYDDGVVADKRLVALFNGYGLKGTFNLNSELFDIVGEWHGRMSEEDTFNTFKDSGQEVAMHGARHIFMSKVPLHMAVKEVADNRAYMEQKYGKIVNGMAYAYGDFNDEVVDILQELGVTYARTTKSTHGFAVPKDWLCLNPTCHHTEPCLNDLCDRFLNENPSEEIKQREPKLFYVWGHSFEFDEQDNWYIIENLAKKVSGKKEVWYATNGEIYDYVKCYESLVFSYDGERVYNPSHSDVWCEIRGKVYKIPSGATIVFDRV